MLTNEEEDPYGNKEVRLNEYEEKVVKISQILIRSDERRADELGLDQ